MAESTSKRNLSEPNHSRGFSSPRTKASPIASGRYRPSRRDLLRLFGFSAAGVTFGSLAAACNVFSGASGPATNTPLQLAIANSPTTLALLLGAEQGRYKQVGFDATYKTFAQAGDAVPAVVAGDAQFGAGASEFPTIGAVAKGADIQILAVTFAQKHVVGLVARSGISSGADLVGKTIGVPLASGTDLWRGLYFQKNGLDQTKVKVVNVPTADTATTFIRGDVQAIFTFQPFIDTALAAVSGSKVIAWAEDDNLWKGHTTMFASKKWLDAHRSDAVKVLRATRDSANWINANYDEAIQLALKYLKQDEKTVRYFLQPSKDVTIFQSPDTVRSEWLAAGKFMNENNLATISDVNGVVNSMLNVDLFNEATK
ncbi:MAG: ABC transporter substrate-binding protein [Chloroflexota bacterium]|nr:ABC transporter substrate-binding protein [Chloroflexota bacterium]